MHGVRSEFRDADPGQFGDTMKEGYLLYVRKIFCLGGTQEQAG